MHKYKQGGIICPPLHRSLTQMKSPSKDTDTWCTEIRSSILLIDTNLLLNTTLAFVVYPLLIRQFSTMTTIAEFYSV